MSSSSETYKVRNERETDMTNENKAHFTLEETRSSIRCLLDNEFALLELTQAINNNKPMMIEVDNRFLYTPDPYSDVLCY